jgi:RimJ/RimL family protein N-acetyltransferase
MIYGDRLRLRAAEREDLPRFVAWLNDPEVTQFLLINLPMSMADEQRWFESMQAQPPAEHVLVIEIKEGDAWRPIGNTSFMDIGWINRSAEIGIFIGEKELWNKGYGRETMRLMIKHGFETLNLNRICLRVYEHNLRGIRAYEHAGFKYEGRMRQAIYKDGRYYDVLWMSVLRNEWFEKNQDGQLNVIR